MQQTNNDLLKQYQPHQSGGGGVPKRTEIA